jgi:Family of unknown function (DUF5990)
MAAIAATQPARPLVIVIRGHHLPGRTFRHAGVPIHGVHVGVQERQDPVGLVAGDAASAEWRIAVRVVQPDSDGGDGGSDDGVDRYDFRGPAVHGPRGARFVYLTWGDVTAAHPFAMFRRAKLMLDHVDRRLVRAALDGGRPLVATIDLTDDRGGPRCGRVVAPALRWSV